MSFIYGHISEKKIISFQRYDIKESWGLTAFWPLSNIPIKAKVFWFCLVLGLLAKRLSMETLLQPNFNDTNDARCKWRSFKRSLAKHVHHSFFLLKPEKKDCIANYWRIGHNSNCCHISDVLVNSRNSLSIYFGY